MDYTGYKQIHLTDDELTQFYSTAILPYEFLENEYLILVDENGNAYKDVDYTDHGRHDTHKVPHTHIIEIGEIIDRKKGAKSYAH